MTKAAEILEATKFDKPFARITALRMTMSLGHANATKRINDRLDAWTGDTRRDGDTPKAFWELVREELKAFAA